MSGESPLIEKLRACAERAKHAELTLGEVLDSCFAVIRRRSSPPLRQAVIGKKTWEVMIGVCLKILR